jgi:hypothetical protein
MTQALNKQQFARINHKNECMAKFEAEMFKMGITGRRKKTKSIKKETEELNKFLTK